MQKLRCSCTTDVVCASTLRIAAPHKSHRRLPLVSELLRNALRYTFIITYSLLLVMRKLVMQSVTAFVPMVHQV